MSNLEPIHKNASDADLVKEADSGLRGQGAVVEMMRRLKDAMDKLERTSSTEQQKMLSFTRWIIGLTVVMVIVALLEGYSVVNTFWSGP